jgi:hypothetical protein
VPARLFFDFRQFFPRLKMGIRRTLSGILGLIGRFRDNGCYCDPGMGRT